MAKSKTQPWVPPRPVCRLPLSTLWRPLGEETSASGSRGFWGILECQLQILIFPLIDRGVREGTAGGSRERRKRFTLRFLFSFHGPEFLTERPLTRQGAMAFPSRMSPQTRLWRPCWRRAVSSRRLPTPAPPPPARR